MLRHRLTDSLIVRFRKVVAVACDALDARREEINDLNVFPVADGDTGDNMVRTLRAVQEELDRLEISSSPNDSEIDRDEIVKAVARAALLGARGNSGVILSQIVRGLAEELASRPGELIDPTLVAAALGRAANAAYSSVREPVEGTMLTLIREMAHAVSHFVAHTDGKRLGPDATASEQDAVIAEVLDRAVATGEGSVARSTELLPVLRESGVVDAGAYGLLVIVAGMLAALREDPSLLLGLSHHAAPLILHAPEHEESEFQFCTNFAVLGEGFNPGSFKDRLDQIGDCVLVVGDETTIRVHVHTDDPTQATAIFDGIGTIEGLDVADMHEQIAERKDRLSGSNGIVPDTAVTPAAQPQGLCGLIAVVTGAGISEMFSAFGATVIDGGPTLNPSTNELLAAIEAAPESEVVLLPNSRNVLMAAENAAELAAKPAFVLPTLSQQAGLSVLISFKPEADAHTNLQTLSDALGTIRTGGVAEAARDDGDGRFRRGESVGFIEDEIVAWGEPAETLEAVLGELGRDSELLTCIAGADAPLDGIDVEGIAPLGPEFELHHGGQPHWWWLIAAE